MEILHQRNIGFVYDLCQVIICKTAKRESWINSYVLNGREELDVEQMDKTLNQFSSLDRCWNLFTALHPKKGRLITKLYIDFVKNTVSDWNEKDFVEYMTDLEVLKYKVTDWYFDSEDLAESEYYSRLQGMQDLSDSIRLNLYEFYTAGETYVARMNDSLHTLVDEMKQFYQKEESVLAAREKAFDYAKVMEQKGDLFSTNSSWNVYISACSVSFSLINRYILLRDEYYVKNRGWILLGIDFDMEVKELGKGVSVTEFGHALSDITRLNILREIHKNGEKTLTDLSKTFSLVNAVMLYHLDILKNERILCQRHEGRRVYYWLNYNRLKQAIYAINSEFGGELIEAMEKACDGGNE